MTETLSKPINVIPILMEDSEDESDGFPFQDFVPAYNYNTNSAAAARLKAKERKTKVSFSPKQTVIVFEKYLKSPQEEREEEERILKFKQSSIGERIKKMFRFKGAFTQQVA